MAAELDAIDWFDVVVNINDTYEYCVTLIWNVILADSEAATISSNSKSE